METLFDFWWFKVVFLIIALISSVLLSKYAWDIHGGEEPKGASLIQQLFLNFLGSFLGWILLWIVLPNLIESIGSHSATNFTAKDILLIIIAFIGITGYLPLALVGLARSFKDIFSKLPK